MDPSVKDFIKNDACCQQICARQGLSDQQQFERACAVRLCQAIVQQCNEREPGCYSLCVQPNAPAEPVTLCVQYKSATCATCCVDQVKLEAGPAGRGAQYFLGDQQRICPDITLLMCPPGQQNVSALCCECCCDNDRQQALQGYQRAALYCAEYQANLRCSPKAALVTCCKVDGAADAQQQVLACNWKNWPAQQLVTACCTEMRKNFQQAAKAQRRA